VHSLVYIAVIKNLNFLKLQLLLSLFVKLQIFKATLFKIKYIPTL